jgi:deoxyribodipyrimidine photo-lyase
MNKALVWFRQDLRLADNPALSAAVSECDGVIPLFIDESGGNSGLLQSASRASHVWLHHALHALADSLNAKDATLLIRRGEALPCLLELIKTAGITHIYWNRRYDPDGIATDTRIKTALSEQGCKVRSFNGNLLDEPWTVLKQDDTPYKVFTAFWKFKLKRGIDTQLLPEPARIPAPDTQPPGLRIDELGYLPETGWDRTMMSHWTVGGDAAQQRLTEFLQQQGGAYKTARDLPAEPGTSRLSPHLHFGEISPRQIYYQAEAYLAEHPGAENGVRTFLSEVGWREFAYYLLYHFPETVTEPLDQRFKQFSWRTDHHTDLQRWQQGMTGFPVIDAGMRELWATGWMHNRVRMIVASLLTKNLLIHWREGEQWFRDTLVDADLASNTMGWQWVAGSGADAAPYFRIFNPLLQSEKFDPAGTYIRRWVPELKDFSNKQIHQPYQYVDQVKNYPPPLVDLKESRQRALDHFAQIKQ